MMAGARDAAAIPSLTIWEEKTLHRTASFVARVLTATEKPSKAIWERWACSNTALPGRPDPTRCTPQEAGGKEL